jgi:golgi to ER traffic protein 4
MQFCAWTQAGSCVDRVRILALTNYFTLLESTSFRQTRHEPAAMPPKDPSPARALAAILPLIASNQPYEAHQKARTFASRYVKAGQYDTAIEVLFQSARELLKSGHQGSGTDLGCLLVDAYAGQSAEVGEETRGTSHWLIEDWRRWPMYGALMLFGYIGRLTQLIALTGSAGNWRKTLIDKSVS